MTTWTRGNVAIAFGEYPAVVLGPEPHSKVRIGFLGGSPGEGLPDEMVIAPGELTRPPGARWLNKSLENQRGKWRSWTGAELRRLRDEWDSTGEQQLAREVGRTVQACRVTRWRWWGSKGHRRMGVLSAREVAEILEVDGHYVTDWLIGRRVLRATKGRKVGTNRVWQVTDRAFETFLRRYPQHYYWRQITRAPWAEIARAVYEADPLLTVTEVAERLCLVPNSVTQQIRLGLLPGVWSFGGRRGSNHGWLVRESALAEAKVGSKMRHWQAARTALFAEQEWVTGPQAAWLLGLNVCTVWRRVRCGRYPVIRLCIGRLKVTAIPRAALGLDTELISLPPALEVGA